jgi:hypothetical protein
MNRRLALAAASLIAALGLTACGTNTPTAAPSSTDRPSDAPAPATAEPADDPTPSASEDGVFKLDETATYKDGPTIKLTHLTRGVSSVTAAPENTAFVKFTAVITNNTKTVMDLSGASLQCQYGKDGHTSEEIFDSEQGLEGTPSTHLRPGRTATTTLACELPRNESEMQIEVAPDFESQPAIFVGTVK